MVGVKEREHRKKLLTLGVLISLQAGGFSACALLFGLRGPVASVKSLREHGVMSFDRTLNLASYFDANTTADAVLCSTRGCPTVARCAMCPRFSLCYNRLMCTAGRAVGRGVWC